ncbi:MAG: class I SAM-dependent rRNA methyltransferase [Deltaproteobacteria bacterium]|nr:class I SAM-dependent rRNA methyltransferase [Deltaproteobacteria bacterium]MBW2394100.1 class I SAM-dependent rRNA methyltransferase [Deltaproteobacteria bacterium]
MSDNPRVSWLYFRVPGLALPQDEVWRRLGRPGAKKQPLCGVRFGPDGWEPGEPQRDAILTAGRALCADVRPVRWLRPPEATRLRLLCGPLAWPEGEAPGFRFHTVEVRGDLRELEVGATTPPDAESPAWLARCALDWLAAAGAPALGDVHRGGVLLRHGLRVRPATESARDDWWPEEPIHPPDEMLPELRVSAATARALVGGHPWVRADRETGDPGIVRVGGRVRLMGPGGRDLGIARTDGEGDLTARRWSLPGERERDVATRVEDALARRAGFHAGSAETDAYRLIHGEADGLPGLAIDRLGPLLRVIVQGRSALPLVADAIPALRECMAEHMDGLPPVLEIVNLRRPDQSRVLAVHPQQALPLDSEGGLTVRESGLRFWVDPGLNERSRPRPGTGLFLDQRENRARLRAEARGGRFANLFAHTGAFSLALLAGGAQEVWSVDLSGAYLRQAEANLALSGLDRARHRVERSDARRFLEEGKGDAGFDGIVIDPPTAAAAGRRFWSVRKDLGPLLERAWSRLAPGGWLLVTRNDRGARTPLARLAEEAAERAGGHLDSIEDAPPSPDFPELEGFPEGDPFEGQLLRKS